MRNIRTDLWETRTDNPFPGLTTHAYLWTGGPDGNVLFYSPASDADFDGIEDLGGVRHQYLSHHDEAGPALERIGARFGADLHAPEPELTEIGKHRTVDVPLGHRHVDNNGIEVIPTPGHTVGSTCYLITAEDGSRLLFTGDTLFVGGDGRWAAGYLPSFSDAESLISTMQLLRTFTPDVVISSGFLSDSAVHVLDRPWSECVDEALEGLTAATM